MNGELTPEEKRSARNLILLVFGIALVMLVIGAAGGSRALEVVGFLLLLVGAFLVGVRRMNR